MENLATVVNWMIPIALGVVFVVLIIGLVALFRGGDFGRSWSNRMMRLRVLAQFVAVLVLLAAYALHRQLNT
jgi:hypothetical protein